MDGLITDAFLGCNHGIRLMRAFGEGSIVNITSRSGLVGIPAAAAYASSMAALVRNVPLRRWGPPEEVAHRLLPGFMAQKDRPT